MAFGIVTMEQIGRSTRFTIELADVTNANATAASKKVNLTWDDPSDVILEGATLAKWGGTLVVRKANSPPTDKDDGTVVVNSTTRNAYSTTPLQDTNLENGVIYYYRFFPYSANGTYTSGTTVSARPSSAQVDVPTITDDFTYDGTTKTPTLNYDSRYVTATGDLSATNAGEYEITFALKSNDYIWSDGTFRPKTVTWNIVKAAGGVAVSAESVKLANSVTSKTLTITQTGDGTLSVESGASAMVVGAIEGSNLIISRVGTSTGTCQMTVKAAESNNYTAAQVVFNVTVVNYRIMTVTIDESNSNPETCCTYADDAVEMDMEPGSADWDEFFGHYPCLLSGGVEGVKLNPNNFDQDIDGNTVDISSGDSGDAMIAFPRHGLRISKSGTVVTVSMTDNPDDENFEYYAHRRGDIQKDKFYWGVYMASNIDGKARSLKNKTAYDNYAGSRANFINAAQAQGAPNGKGGSGYDVTGWFQVIYIQAMYVLKYKNLNSQTVIGQGLNTTGRNTPVGKLCLSTGGTETWGMDKRNGAPTNKSQRMKLFGMEDLWGGLKQYIAGITRSKKIIRCTTDNLSATYSNMTAVAQLSSEATNGFTTTLGTFVSQVVGDSIWGFMAHEDSGSATTYYCDNQGLWTNQPNYYSWGCFSYYQDEYASHAGIFCIQGQYFPNNSGSGGIRLMYL